MRYVTWIPKIFKSHAVLFLVAAAMLSSCGNIEGSLSSAFLGQSANTLSGKVILPASSSAASVSGQSLKAANVSALGCTNGIVQIFKTGVSGENQGDALASTTLGADGSYTFPDTSKFAGELSNKGSSTSANAIRPLILKVTGCTQTLRRFVTGQAAQNISVGSTLLASLAGTTSVTYGDSTKLDGLLQQLEPTTSQSAAFSLITSNAQIAATFNQIFGISPSTLLTVPPQVDQYSVPTSGAEGSPVSLSANVNQWNPDYSIALEWHDTWVEHGTSHDKLIATSSNAVWSPGANKQGARNIRLVVGQSDGNGAVDLSKPFRTQNFAIHIADTTPVSVPGVSFNGAILAGVGYVNSATVNLNLATGAHYSDGSFQNCQNFSDLAVVESDDANPILMPPQTDAGWNIQCQSGPQQSIQLTLASGIGSKTLKIWARDSAGNVTAAPLNIPIHYSTAVPVLAFNTAANTRNNGSLALTGVCEAASSDVTISGPIDDGSGNNTLTTACAGGVWNATVLFTGSDGAKPVTVSQTNIFGSTGTATRSFVLDRVRPTAVIATSTSSPTNSTSIGYSVTFSKPVHGLSTAAMSVANGSVVANSLTPTTGFNNVYQFNIAPASDGAVTVSLAQGQVSDDVGNTNLVSNQVSVTSDRTAPALAFTSPAASTSAQSGLTIAGTCEAGLTVALSGAGLSSPSSATCTSGTFSVAVVFTSGDGTKAISVSQTDAAGNTGSATRSFVKDNVAPSLAITSPAADTSAQTGLTIAGTCEAGLAVTLSGSGISSPSSTTCTSGTFSVAVVFTSGDGTKAISVSQTDAAGNTGAASQNFVKDTTPPVLAFTSPAANASAQTGLTVAGTCEAGLAVTLSGSGISSPSSTTCTSGTFSVAVVFTSGDGTKAISVSQTDAAGNTGAASQNFVKDTTPPALAFTSPAANASAQTGLTIAGTCEAGLSVALSGAGLSSPSSTTCASGTFNVAVVFTSGDGSKTITVSQTDAAGNTGSVSQSFIKDTTPPALAFTSPAANTSAQTGLTIAGTCEAGLSVALSGAGLSSPASTTCASGTFSVAVVFTANDGSKTITVSQTDAAGNTGSASLSFVKDNVAPGPATLTLTSASFSNSLNMTFSVSCATDVDKILYSTSLVAPSPSDSAWEACGTSKTLTTGMGDGLKTFYAYVKDAAGNVSTSSFVSMTLDQTAPTVSLTSLSGGGVFAGGSQQAITWSASDTNIGSTPVSLAYSTDGGSTWTAIATSIANSGSYNWTLPAANSVQAKVRVTSIDLASNSTAVSSSANFTIDSTPPAAPTVSRASSANSNSTTVSVNVTCTGDFAGILLGSSSSQPAANNSAWQICSTPVNFTVAAGDGSKTIYVWTKDAAGNVSTTSGSVSMTLDQTAPTLTLSGTPSSITNSVNPSFTFTATDALSGVSGFQCKMDSGSYASCTSPTSFTSVSAGSHTFYIYAYDVAGNSTTASSYTWTIDTTPPTVTISSSPFTITNSTSASFSFSATDSGGGTVAGFQCKLDAGSYGACTSPKAYSGLSQASHTFYVTATDSVGNTSNATTSTWTVDTTAPTITITSPSANGTTVPSTSVTSFTIGGACSENGLGVTIAGSVNTTATCSSGAWSISADLSGLSDGTLSVTANQVDLAGNSTTTAARTFIKDTVVPSVSLTAFASSPYLGGASQNIAWTASDTNALGTNPIKLEYSSDNGSSWTTILSATANTSPYSWTLPSVSGTQYKLRITATDAAGNTANATSAAFTIDSAKPVLSSFTVNGGVTTSTTNNVAITLQATDNMLISHFCLLYNNTTTPALTDACWIPVANAGLSPSSSISISNYYYRLGFTTGTYNVYAFVRDQAGNISTLGQTNGVDSGSVTYSAGSPPTVNQVIAASSDSPSSPLSSTDLTATSGTSVYIKWQIASSSTGFGSTPVQLYYTTDDSTWTAIGAATANAQGTGCTISGALTGCYVWTNGSPTSGYFKVRVKATDTASLTAQANSQSFNASVFNFLAGNTELGTNGSASSGIFLNTIQGDIRTGDFHSLVVHPNGTIYFKDTTRGVMKVDPNDGLLKVFIPMTGTSSGDGGAATSATLKAAALIALDGQNNLLIYDYNRIRRVNLSASTPTISTIIGGGASTSDTLIDPTQFALKTVAQNAGYQVVFNALPNGDLIFRGDCSQTNREGCAANNKFRWYHASSSSLTSIYITGAFPNHPSIDIGTCQIVAVTPILDTSNNVQSFAAVAFSDPTSYGHACSYDANWDTIDGIFDTTGAYVSALPATSTTDQMFLGRDGKVYDLQKSVGVLKVLNTSTSTWTNLAATGAGYCADGTALGTCKIFPDDAFIDPNGKIYFAENGRVRTVSDSNTLYTVVGQALSYGDGLNPLQSRMQSVTSMGIWNDGSKDRVVILDQGQHVLREFDLTGTGTMQTLGGCGTPGTPNTTAAASGQCIQSGLSNGSAFTIGVDPSGDVFMASGPNLVGKLNRSTGKWGTFAGGGSTYWYSGDTLAGTSVKFNNGNQLMWVLGYGNGQVLVDTGARNGSNYDYPFYKTYDATTAVQSTLVGVNSTSQTLSYTWCAVGTALTGCLIPTTDQSYVKTAVYDSIGGAWLMSAINGTTTDKIIHKLVAGGTMQTYYTSSTVFKAFALNKTSSQEYLYFCDQSSSPFKIKKVNMQTSTLTTLSWPISSMSCDGYNMVYSSSRNSLIFSYKQNGINGVVEYLNP